jgi:hypothetical protein
MLATAAEVVDRLLDAAVSAESAKQALSAPSASCRTPGSIGLRRHTDKNPAGDSRDRRVLDSQVMRRISKLFSAY